MADFYCDHGAYGTYTATPTWGVAQEGDGEATGLATPAIASIVLVGQPSASDTLVVMGVTLTAVASGATGNQFNIGASLDATANNIATVINASTTTVGSGVSTTTPQLRNLNFARGPSTGAPAATVQIMTRAGSTHLNHASNSAVAITKTGAWNPTITQFAGGASGVWGYLVNQAATIWPSAVAIRAYGAIYTAANAGPLVVHTAVTVNDVLNIRSNGHEIIIARNVSSTMPTWAAQYLYLWDDGTVWPGDSGVFTIRLRNDGGASAAWNFNGVNQRIALASRSKYNLEVIFDGTGTAACDFAVPNASQMRCTLQRIKFTEPSTNGATTVNRVAIAANQGTVNIRECWFRFERNDFKPPVQSSGNFTSMTTIIDSCKFEWTAFTGTPSTLVLWTAVASNETRVEVVDTEAITINPGMEPVQMNVSSFATWNSAAVVRNVRGMRIPAAILGLVGAQSAAGIHPEKGGGIFMQGVGPKRTMRMETASVMVEWNDTGGFPVSDAYLPDGTPWSYRVLFAAANGNAIRQDLPVEVISLTKTNILADGVRTLALELKLDDLYDHLITFSHLVLHIAYTDATGQLRLESTNAFSTAALPSSGKAWTDQSGTFNGTHVPRKLEITTQASVKQNTEIEARLVAMREPTVTQTFFINPELTIA